MQRAKSVPATKLDRDAISALLIAFGLIPPAALEHWPAAQRDEYQRRYQEAAAARELQHDRQKTARARSARDRRARKAIILAQERRTRRSDRADQEALDIIETDILLAELPAGAAGGAEAGLLVYNSDSEPSSAVRRYSTAATNTRGPKSWERLTPRLRLVTRQLALAQADWRPMTIHLHPDICDKMDAHADGAVPYLLHRISQQLERDLGRPVDFWFKIERFRAPERGRPYYERCRPHLHGAIEIPPGVSLGDIKIALSKAAGFKGIIRPGAQDVDLPKKRRSGGGIRWVLYAIKTSFLDALAPSAVIPSLDEIRRQKLDRQWPLDGHTVGVTRSLQQRSRRLWPRLRESITARAS